MTDISAKCPKCGRKATNYFHFVDRVGMSDTIPNGTYTITCAKQYATIPRKGFCYLYGTRFSVLPIGTRSKRGEMIEESVLNWRCDLQQNNE